MKKSLKNNLLYLISGILVAIVIYLIAYLLCGNEYVLPSPVSVIEETALLFISKSFYEALGGTLLRVLGGFIISFIVAVILAVLARLYPFINGVLSVIVGALRSLPVLAVLLIILTSVSRTVAPIVVCFLSLFPILYTAFINALKGVPSELEEMCSVYKIPLKRRIFSLYIPHVLPRILLDSASGFSFGLKLVVSAEILASVYGSVGGIIKEASLYLLTSRLFALTLAVCLIGIIVEFIGKILSEKTEKKLL